VTSLRRIYILTCFVTMTSYEKVIINYVINIDCRVTAP